MDTGQGNFTSISELRANTIQEALTHNGNNMSGIFVVGEKLTIKGSLFEVQSIGRKKMKLRLLNSVSSVDKNEKVH